MIRAAIVGIDGSGKTSTAVELVRRLAPRMNICKPGRPPLVARGGRTTTYLAAEARTLEAYLQRYDRSEDRLRIAFSRQRYLRFVIRCEREMVRRFQPDLLLLARCPLVDPAIYADFYLPWLARLSLGQRLTLARAMARVPPRDIYFFLDTPVPVAMARIHGRLAVLNSSPDGREHWLHMHEQPRVLEGLRAGFARALEIVGRRTGARVVRIDNSRMRQDGVAALMVAQILGAASARTRGAGRPVSEIRPLPGGAELPLRAAGPGVASRAALAPVGPAGLAVFLASSDLVTYQLDLEAELLIGPAALDRCPVEDMVVLAPASPGQDDAWLVYTALTGDGRVVKLARFACQQGESGRIALICHPTLVPGAAPAGALGVGHDGEPLALVVYVEPSHTELWGLILGGDARVLVRPFPLCAAEPGHLLCDDHGRGSTRVRFASSGSWAGWTVTCTSCMIEAEKPLEESLARSAGDGACFGSRRVELRVDSRGCVSASPGWAACDPDPGPPGDAHCLAAARIGRRVIEVRARRAVEVTLTRRSC